MNKIRKILEEFITEDDKGRKRVKYNLTKTIDKYEKRIKNLKLKDVICLFIIFNFILFISQSFAVTKCYKDVCIGDRVFVIDGLYKGNYANIWDIIREKTPEEDEVEMIDLYKYFVSFDDGSIAYLYRDMLKILEE